MIIQNLVAKTISPDSSDCCFVTIDMHPSNSNQLDEDLKLIESLKETMRQGICPMCNKKISAWDEYPKEINFSEQYINPSKIEHHII